MNTYTVSIQSVPGDYSQHSGNIQVKAANAVYAIRVALEELQQGEFPDRVKSMWKITRVVQYF